MPRGQHDSVVTRTGRLTGQQPKQTGCKRTEEVTQGQTAVIKSSFDESTPFRESKVMVD
jgi:hypothetical protein